MPLGSCQVQPQGQGPTQQMFQQMGTPSRMGHHIPTVGPPAAPQNAPMTKLQIPVDVFNRGPRVAQAVSTPGYPTPQTPARDIHVWKPQMLQQSGPGTPPSMGNAKPGQKPQQKPQPQPQPQPQPPVAKEVQNDCGCKWFACPLCNGGKVPELDVACVSLGSWCGVSQCLRGLKFRTTAFPFDWNRVSMDGVIHFLENRFSDFVQWQTTKDFPWDPDHGGKAYCGEYHSFWHDDLSKPEEAAKYKRRIDRFLNDNAVKKKLFIRAANEKDDVAKAEKLLQLLKETFPDNEVWLLMIVDHQPAADSFVLDGTEGKLMMHLTDKRHIRTHMYYDDVKAYEEAVLMALGAVNGRPMSASFRQPRLVDSMSKFVASLEPFYCGNPQNDTWDPKPVTPQVPKALPSAHQLLRQGYNQPQARSISNQSNTVCQWASMSPLRFPNHGAVPPSPLRYVPQPQIVSAGFVPVNVDLLNKTLPVFHHQNLPRNFSADVWGC